MPVPSPLAAVPLWTVLVAALYAGVVFVVALLCRAASRGDQLAQAAEAPDVAGGPLVHRPRTLDGLVAEAARAVGADDAALFGWSLQSDALEVVAAHVAAGGATSPAAARLADRASATGRLCVRPPSLVPADGEPALPGAALAVPAGASGLRLGALCVTRRGARPFTARDRAVLLRLGGAATLLLAAGAGEPGRSLRA